MPVDPRLSRTKDLEEQCEQIWMCVASLLLEAMSKIHNQDGTTDGMCTDAVTFLLYARVSRKAYVLRGLE